MQFMFLGVQPKAKVRCTPGPRNTSQINDGQEKAAFHLAVAANHLSLFFGVGLGHVFPLELTEAKNHSTNFSYRQD